MIKVMHLKEALSAFGHSSQYISQGEAEIK